MNPTSELVIELDPALALRLTTYAHTTGLEFSGLGFCDRHGNTIYVYDFALLDVGSAVYTEIPPEKLLSLAQRPDVANMKVWIHRHPIGDGIPGPRNWSGTDENTIRKEPLGSVPELVGWSVSIVITPNGWVGRIDNYINGKTRHLRVLPDLKTYALELASLRLDARILPGELWSIPCYNNRCDYGDDFVTQYLDTSGLLDLVREYGSDATLADLAPAFGIRIKSRKHFVDLSRHLKGKNG